MGKTEGEASSDGEPSPQNVEPHGFRSIQTLIGLRCIFVLFLSLALFLSAIFWLPPFLQFADQSDLDLQSKFRGQSDEVVAAAPLVPISIFFCRIDLCVKRFLLFDLKPFTKIHPADHYIVASFNLRQPVSLLEDNIMQLEDNIFDEIVVPSTKVVILSLDPLGGLNVTRVVFGVDPDPKSSKLLPTSQSLIRASFEYLVTHQSLRLNTSLFGPTHRFEVLKFPGGITIIPPQNAFLLQKVQILFNFTLNFSILQIQENFNELKSQLKSGLHLAPYENLYVSLSNSKGSTVAPPTTVQSSVLLTIGNTPSMQRLKQLAQTITHSHSRNLGLNNTVFGRVKQVRLSSILQHSLNGGDGTGSPSPAPLPHPHPHHHSHHHHHHHHISQQAPAISPAPATGSGAPATHIGSPGPDYRSPLPQIRLPAPEKSYEAKPPSFWSGRRGKTGKQSHLPPAGAPNVSPPICGPSPRKPSAPIYSSVPASGPLSHVVFSHALPPSKSESDNSQSYTMPSPEPSQSTSASTAYLPSVVLALSLLVALVLHI